MGCRHQRLSSNFIIYQFCCTAATPKQQVVNFHASKAGREEALFFAMQAGGRLVYSCDLGVLPQTKQSRTICSGLSHRVL